MGYPFAPHNRRKIAEWIRCGYVLGFHLGTPCESFSRARDVPPGPPLIRSNSQPLGLPNLKPRDQLKVQCGNLFMRFSAFLLSLACRFCIPATLENPQWPRLWLCPAILAILRRRQVSLVMTTFCAWGSPFGKATSFLSVYVDLWRLQDHKCTSSRRGVCEYSQAKHVPIQGQNSQGQWWTKIAEPYPPRLCSAIAKSFFDWNVQQVANRFQIFLAPKNGRQ